MTEESNLGGGTSATKSVYLATYSSVAVFELMVRGIACMRRRTDGYINATQVLKIAGIEKAKRTKILEKEILTGEHEKVQGGYGKYQGTWIPLNRAQELSATYNVAHLLEPLLHFDPSTAASVPVAGPRRRPNPNAPAASIYHRQGTGAQQKSAVKGAAATASNGISSQAVALAGPSQQPRFLPLRPPPDLESPNTYPRGTTAEQRDLLSSFSSHSYTPPGAPLANNTGKSKRSADDMQENGVEGEREAKKSRSDTLESSAGLANGKTIAPSPVKDLNALGRITSPTSAWRGARAPTRLNRVSLGPPDALRVLQLNGTRFADRPQTLHEGDEGEKRMRARILQLFVEAKLAEVDPEEGSESPTSNDLAKMNDLLLELRHAASLAGHNLQAEGGDVELPPVVDLKGPPPCVDLVIDDHGHTALHWSAALAKLAHVRMLVSTTSASGGANPHAGNHGGETALQRAVLVSNSYDSSTFPILLHLLSPSLHTRDYRKRTVLHHIALVSALRGRGVAARYYLACVLEYIALHQSGRYAALIDAQDEDGETALSIVARIGNASMVKMLLDVGARKDITNALGLKPSDWGIEELDVDHDDASKTTGAPEKQASDVISSLTKPPKAPVQKSKDVLEQMSAVLSDLSDVFQKEIDDKEEALTVAQAHLQSATRELATRRRRIAEGQARVAEKDEAKLRRVNLVRTLQAELGVGEEEGEAELISRCLQFEKDILQKKSTRMDLDAGPLSSSSLLDQETVFADPKGDDSTVKMRWLRDWYKKHLDSLQARIGDLHQSSQSKLDQCRRVVAMCCGVPENKVEAMLDDLVAAIESIGVEGVDLQRLAGFLSKVNRNPQRIVSSELPIAS
ncbi:hypothetical protein CBS101457_002564 [Exobasidium rhododendri]|nr:hypothetical protein CBS101457_002564 [Exobasidium rhododendri]